MDIIQASTFYHSKISIVQIREQIQRKNVHSKRTIDTASVFSNLITQCAILATQLAACYATKINILKMPIILKFLLYIFGIERDPIVITIFNSMTKKYIIINTHRCIFGCIIIIICTQRCCENIVLKYSFKFDA